MQSETADATKQGSWLYGDCYARAEQLYLEVASLRLHITIVARGGVVALDWTQYQQVTGYIHQQRVQTRWTKLNSI